MRRGPGLVAAALGTAALTLLARPATAQAPHPLSLAEAVRIAIASDAELYIAREEARAAEDGIALARAAFGRRLFGEAYLTRNDAPPSARQFAALDTIGGANVGLAGRIETGMTYTLSAGLVRHSREDPFSTVYAPATTTTLRAEVIQPLLRGAFSAARRPLVVASLRKHRSEHELRARVERTVGAVEIAYWNLVRARSERDARASALELAKEQVEESKRLTRFGTGSDLDVVEAQAGVSRRQQELLRTEQDVVEAEGRLVEAIGVRASEAGWAAGGAIAPTDPAQIEPLAPEIEAQLALARGRRSDVLAAHEALAAERAELSVTADQRRASIDLVAAAGTVGFAGAFTSNYLTGNVNNGGLDPPYTPDPAYEGGLGSSLRNTLGRDLHVYLGVRLEVPLGNHTAEVRHAIQQRNVTRAQLTERETLARIETEVRTTVGRVGVSVRAVEAADEAVALTEKLLEGTRKRFRAGAGTSFDVLRVSEELTRARVEAARARADYRVNLTRLGAATGTLLDRLNVSVGDLGATPR